MSITKLLSEARAEAKNAGAHQINALAASVLRCYLADRGNTDFKGLNDLHTTLSRGTDTNERQLGSALYMATLEASDFNRRSYAGMVAAYRRGEI